MAARLKSATTSVVLVGQFNPAVFHPSWFAARELLPPEQVEQAIPTVKAIVNDVMAFEAGWLSFQALPMRCAFTSTESAYHLELRDLALGTLTLLAEEPVAALGLNRDAHYSVDTEDEWHAIGDRFVPNEPWTELTGGVRAGLQRLVVQLQREGTELRDGSTNVTVGVSAEVPERGVFVGINEHFQLAPLDNPMSAAAVLPVLEAEWEPARERANAITVHIIG